MFELKTEMPRDRGAAKKSSNSSSSPLILSLKAWPAA
jgi:hypothetical protein